MTPNRSQRRDRSEQSPVAPPVDTTTLDPDFDSLGADAEFTAWRWPERDDE